MIEIVEDFLPINDFRHFAHSAMTAPYYVPCDFSTKESEADGSIGCFGEDGPQKQSLTNYVSNDNLRRVSKENRSIVSDFYYKHFPLIDCIRELLNVKRFYNIRVGCTQCKLLDI